MGTITLTKSFECTSGDHIRIAITGDVPSNDISIYMPDLLEPINEEEKRAFLKVLLKVAKIGRNNNQVKTALTNGYTITI